jgi:hypothetical protein
MFWRGFRAKRSEDIFRGGIVSRHAALYFPARDHERVCALEVDALVIDIRAPWNGGSVLKTGLAGQQRVAKPASIINRSRSRARAERISPRIQSAPNGQRVSWSQIGFAVPLRPRDANQSLTRRDAVSI